ncbi:hypothetical protein PoB_005642500 [Plakobranchus ocellatus]|uniref:Uncharacterized protein n=1 Tax=Plakobranchus ocellatus TaxID=259542 RepID=A0AAV4CB02_9GAST|nr:hypothetical protein PoB_005642500 [Plakobranchus ocellatus]
MCYQTFHPSTRNGAGAGFRTETQSRKVRAGLRADSLTMRPSMPPHLSDAGKGIDESDYDDDDGGGFLIYHLCIYKDAEEGDEDETDKEEDEKEEDDQEEEENEKEEEKDEENEEEEYK